MTSQFLGRNKMSSCKTDYANRVFQVVVRTTFSFFSARSQLSVNLDVQKKIEKLQEKRNALLTELDTQIKVSNATTFVEI